MQSLNITLQISSTIYYAELNKNVSFLDLYKSHLLAIPFLALRRYSACRLFKSPNPSFAQGIRSCARAGQCHSLAAIDPNTSEVNRNKVTIDFSAFDAKLATEFAKPNYITTQ